MSMRRRRVRRLHVIQAGHTSTGRSGGRPRIVPLLLGSHGGSHAHARLRPAVDADGCWDRPDLRKWMKPDTSGRPPDALLIRGFRVRSPGGPPVLTCMFGSLVLSRRFISAPFWASWERNGNAPADAGAFPFRSHEAQKGAEMNLRESTSEPNMQVKTGGPPGDRTRNPRIKRASGGRPDVSGFIHFRRSGRSQHPSASTAGRSRAWAWLPPWLPRSKGTMRGRPPERPVEV